MTHFTQLQKQHTDIPDAVLLKAALLFDGLAVTPALLEAGRDAIPHFHTVRRNGQEHQIPYFIWLPDGAGEELLVLVRPADKSPWHVRDDGQGGLALYDDDAEVSELRVAPRPRWHRRIEEQEKQEMLYALSQHGGMLVANLTPACEYWQADVDGGPAKCRFCGYGAVSHRSRGLRQERGMARPPADVLQAFEQTVAEARPEADHLFLVGGSMLDRDCEGERYLALTEAAVRGEPAWRGAIGCGSQALPAAWTQRIRDAGAGYACFNLEVWDPARWQVLCPGKAAWITREQWLEDMLAAVEVFGRGGVLSAFVAGVELVPPAGFADREEALASALAGTDWLLARGIVPLYSPFSPAPNATYDQASGPDMGYFLRLNLEAARLRRRHELPVNRQFVSHRDTYAQLECDLDRLL